MIKAIQLYKAVPTILLININDKKFTHPFKMFRIRAGTTRTANAFIRTVQSGCSVSTQPILCNKCSLARTQCSQIKKKTS